MAKSPIKGKQKRFYNNKWKINYPWFYLDNNHDGAFCKLCEKHLVNNSVLFASSRVIFVKTPLKND